MADSPAPFAAYDASPGQRLLWLLGHYRGREGALNVPLAARLRGPLDPSALQAAVDGVVARHEALRTTYHQAGRRLTLHVHPPRPVPLTRAPARPETVMRAVTARAAEPLDPGRWPVRGWLWRLGATEHVLLLSIHHLSADATSHLILVSDLAKLYDRACHRRVTVPDAGWPYTRWIAWQREHLEAGAGERWSAFWRPRLDGASPVDLAIPTPARVPDEPAGPRSRSVRRPVDPRLVHALRALGARQRATLPAVTLGIFYALLAQRSGHSDLLVASLFSDRPRPEVRRTVGFFMNMLLLRAHLAFEQEGGAVIAAARRVLLEAMTHRGLPHQMLPAGTLPAVGGRTADDVVFQFIDAFGEQATEGGVRFEALPLQLNEGRFLIELVVGLNEGDCFVNLRYDDRRCDAAWAEAFVEDYLALTHRLAANPERTLKEILWPAGRQ